ncbi:MAG: hypothetical protein K8R87_03080 [Verrucomicrobia bacterium]|nr:hypothetical protein [Verrucomicrobiota bacterium]
MQQAWNIKSCSHECARTGRLFVEGENFHTAIHFDTNTGEFIRRDVSAEAWAEEIAERTPFSSWQSAYVKPETAPARPEITGRESAENLLRKLCEDDQPNTENARYILTLMLERKKLLMPKEAREGAQGRMLIYEHRKTGEVFIIRDPELRLDEIESVQDEVAMLLGFGGPAAEAAAAVGMAITPEGNVVPAEQA